MSATATTDRHVAVDLYTLISSFYRANTALEESEREKIEKDVYNIVHFKASHPFDHPRLFEAYQIGILPFKVQNPNPTSVHEMVTIRVAVRRPQPGPKGRGCAQPSSFTTFVPYKPEGGQSLREQLLKHLHDAYRLSTDDLLDNLPRPTHEVPHGLFLAAVEADVDVVRLLFGARVLDKLPMRLNLDDDHPQGEPLNAVSVNIFHDMPAAYHPHLLRFITRVSAHYRKW